MRIHGKPEEGSSAEDKIGCNRVQTASVPIAVAHGVAPGNVSLLRLHSLHFGTRNFTEFCVPTVP
jgi:hypothetical protein